MTHSDAGAPTTDARLLFERLSPAIPRPVQEGTAVTRRLSYDRSTGITVAMTRTSGSAAP